MTCLTSYGTPYVTLSSGHNSIKRYAAYDYQKEFDNLEFNHLAEQKKASDPLILWNRSIFSFNHDVAYPLILDPIANLYIRITNSTVRLGISNFLDTWYNGISNVFLSGVSFDLEGLLISIWRMGLNVAFGIGGFYDVADDFNVPAVDKSIGQVLSYYGMGSGSYIVIPFLGPSDVRDVLGLGIRFALVHTLLNAPHMFPRYTYIGSLHHKANVISNINLALVTTTSFNTYVQTKPILEDLNATSLDPYIAYRESFLQNRDFVINKENMDIKNGRFNNYPSDQRVPVFRDRMIDTNEDINDHVIGSRYVQMD